MAEDRRVSRRTFITSGVAVGVGGVAATSLATGFTPARLISAMFASDGPVALRRSTFTPLLNQHFDMAGYAGSANVVLAAINDLQPVNVPNDEDRFALLFHASLSDDLDQGVYTFSNSSMGQVALLAVPVDMVEGNRHYEVVVNRSNFTSQPPTTTTTTPPTTEPPTTTPPTTTPPTTEAPRQQVPTTTEPPTTEPPTTEPPTTAPPTTTTAPLR
jgi:hypothetical protein